MAAPVITALNAPTNAIAGSPFTVEIVASDPSARPVTLTATVTNTSGEAASQSVTVDVGSGAFVYTLTTDDPNTVITAGATPGTFTVVA